MKIYNKKGERISEVQVITKFMKKMMKKYGLTYRDLTLMLDDGIDQDYLTVIKVYDKESDCLLIKELKAIKVE